MHGGFAAQQITAGQTLAEAAASIASPVYDSPRGTDSDEFRLF